MTPLEEKLSGVGKGLGPLYLLVPVVTSEKRYIVLPGIRNVIPEITLLTLSVEELSPDTVLLSMKVQPEAGKLVAGVPLREELL
jgi:hypothetical protein